jgi:hypothetical protein
LETTSTSMEQTANAPASLVMRSLRSMTTELAMDRYTSSPARTVQIPASDTMSSTAPTLIYNYFLRSLLGFQLGMTMVSCLPNHKKLADEK